MTAQKTSRIPVLLSAFICPGIGQLVQKRWIAGGFYLLSFMVGFIWLMAVAVSTIIAYYKMGMEFETYDPATVSWSAIIAPFLVSIILYILNIFDVVVAQQRAASKEREEAFAKAFLADND